MDTIKYNTQLNTKFRIFKIYTPWEFFGGIVLAGSPVFVRMLIGLSSKPLENFGVFAFYTIFILAFKVGKPEGYLEHFIKNLLTPDELRAGLPIHTYPIKPDQEKHVKLARRTEDELANDIRVLQIALIQNNLVPINSYGRFMILDPKDTDSKEYFIEQVKNGGILGMGARTEHFTE